MKEFLKAHETFLRYLVSGVTATALETTLYWALYEKIGIANVPSTFLAWFLTMIYCFFMNKFYVYCSPEKAWKKVLGELLGFYSCRISTGVLNMVYMYLTVDVLHWWPVGMKLSAAVIVGIINYLVGKLLVFKKKA